MFCRTRKRGLAVRSVPRSTAAFQDTWHALCCIRKKDLSSRVLHRVTATGEAPFSFPPDRQYRHSNLLDRQEGDESKEWRALTRTSRTAMLVQYSFCAVYFPCLSQKGP